MRSRPRLPLVLPILLASALALIPCHVFAQTSGKVAGQVIDAQTNEPLPGASVIIRSKIENGKEVGMKALQGAATDGEGEYFILNVRPGTYIIEASFIGYATTVQQGVRVQVDRTSTVDFRLSGEGLVGEEVIVTAERSLVTKDLTSSSAKVSSEELEALPIDDFSDALQLQAGITTGLDGSLHIRGGRSSEIQYYVDGIAVSNPFTNGLAVPVENNAIAELEVISGTFNAEYGQAMSGIVNIVTREGSETFSGSFSGDVGGFATSNTDIFQDLGGYSATSQQNYEASFSGPLPLPNMTFYLSGRLTDQQNWLFGERRFLPSDSSSFQATNPDDWNIVATGDGAAVAMNPFESMSGQGKVTWQVTPTFKASYNLLANTTTGRNYNHAFRLNPDGVPTSETASYNHLLKFEQTLGTRSFYNLNLALYVNELDNRLFEDPNDERYTSVFGRGIQPQFVFETGGLIPDVLNRDSRTYAARFDFTTQLTKSNLVKLGAEVRYHDLFFEFFRIEVDPIRFGTYERFIPPVTSLNNDTYSVNPLEIAAFIQDKIEIQDLIVNVGLRLDYFDPQSVIPTDLRDPSNRIFVGPADEAFEDVDPKIQLSPRLGLAFPITERGVIHASYGQFFQIPEFARLYENPEFEVVGVFSEFVGNANLDAQRTDMYEIGVQQQLNDFSAVDVTMFYRDVRNLLGTDLFETYRADFYGRYANDDYGAVRGVTVALDVVVREMGVSAGADYTYQAAKGIASDPKQEFFDAAGRNEGAVSLAPLNWDARHSGNLFVSYNTPSWGASVVSRATSGFPFTPRNAQTGSSFVELRNRARYRGSFFVDLRAYYQFDLAGFTPQVFIRLDNAFDTVRRDFLPRLDPREEAAHLANGLGVVNTRYDFALNPAAQPVPRTLRFGLKVGF